MKLKAGQIVTVDWRKEPDDPAQDPQPPEPNKLRPAAVVQDIVELLRNDWTGGISAGMAWLVFLQVERRLPPLSPEPED